MQFKWAKTIRPSKGRLPPKWWDRKPISPPIMSSDTTRCWGEPNTEARRMLTSQKWGAMKSTRSAGNLTTMWGLSHLPTTSIQLLRAASLHVSIPYRSISRDCPWGILVISVVIIVAIAIVVVMTVVEIMKTIAVVIFLPFHWKPFPNWQVA